MGRDNASDGDTPPWDTDSRSVNPTRIDLSDARRLIAKSALTIVAERDLNHGQGVQLRTAEGPILSVYNTKKCVLGGTRQELLQFARDDDNPPLAARKPTPEASKPTHSIEQAQQPQKRVNIICPNCGSDDICAAASAYWSVPKQSWEVPQHISHQNCNHRGYESAEPFKRIEVDARWATPNQIATWLPVSVS